MDLLELENIVVTQLQYRVTAKVGTLYPDISFSTEISDDTPSFPNVYVHELSPVEIGGSLENDTIRAIRDTVQIEVTTNTEKADARIVMNACINVMKLLRYSITMLPIYQKNNNVHRFIIRAQRVVASGDKF